MFQKLRRWYTSWCINNKEKARLKRISSPDIIAARAMEMAHLVHLASCAALPAGNKESLKGLRLEMLDLAQMAGSPAFAMLSEKRRINISRSLEHSRECLLSAIQTGLPTVHRVQ